MVNITALSQYLSEDLHEHFEQLTLSYLANFDSLGPEWPEGSPYTGDPQSLLVRGVGARGAERERCFNTDRTAGPQDPHSPYGSPLPSSVGNDVVSGEGGPESLLARGRIRVGVVRAIIEALPESVASRALVRSLAKKYRDEITASAEDSASEKFLAVNERCKNWKLNLQFSWEEELFGLFKTEIDDFFHPGGEPLVQSEDTIWNRGRTGPGASLGANGVDFYTKLFSSDLTATSFEVYYQYAAFCAADPNWRDAEFTRLTTFGLPSITLESSMSFVPKNRDTMRTICTEPSLNMFAQLGLGAILEDRLARYFGIDFSAQQERNAELARLGSIGGAISTIDLESASDSMSLGMLESVLPDWVFDTLLQYRCPLSRLRGEQVKLNMISTMGNGYTFPLQTIIFSCAVQAVAKQFGAPMRRADLSWSPWGVFGDDIALPTFMVDRLVRLLDILGFRVNGEKSFTDKYGTFRESCGSDFYLGHNVRGLYIKTLRTPQSRYVAINLLNEWSARWGIMLRRTIGYLRDSVRLLAVPAWVGIDSGIRIPSSALLSGYVMVYRSKRWRYSYLFRCYEAVVPSLRVLEDSIAIPRNMNHIPRRSYNPSGLMLAAIGGYLSGGRIPLALKQGEVPRYRMRTGVSPFWGPTVEQIRLQGSAFWERWNSAALDNLGF